MAFFWPNALNFVDNYITKTTGLPSSVSNDQKDEEHENGVSKLHVKTPGPQCVLREWEQLNNTITHSLQLTCKQWEYKTRNKKWEVQYWLWLTPGYPGMLCSAFAGSGSTPACLFFSSEGWRQCKFGHLRRR